ncbi:MAG: hypothetical protein KC496_17070, partial [Anaerolineae bacterium]|nr:hypothetical protein [Anaerolineae bacterium]
AADRLAYEFLDESRLQTLKCYTVSNADSPTTEVVVLDWLYRRGQTWVLFPATRVDLDGYIPTAGYHLLAAIWLDANNAVEVTTSTAKDLVDPLGLDDIQECQDAASAGAIPVHIWRLYGGQTAVVEADSMGNLRQRINLPGYEIIQDDGVDVAQRQKLNLRAGSGMVLTITDDSGNDVTDVLFESTGGYGGGYFDYVTVDYGGYYQRQTLNLVSGTNITFNVSEDAGSDILTIEVNSTATGGGDGDDITPLVLLGW